MLAIGLFKIIDRHFRLYIIFRCRAGMLLMAFGESRYSILPDDAARDDDYAE